MVPPSMVRAAGHRDSAPMGQPRNVPAPFLQPVHMRVERRGEACPVFRDVHQLEPDRVLAESGRLPSEGGLRPGGAQRRRWASRKANTSASHVRTDRNTRLCPARVSVPNEG